MPYHPGWQPGQAEIAAAGGAGRRSAKIAAASYESIARSAHADALELSPQCHAVPVRRGISLGCNPSARTARRATAIPGDQWFGTRAWEMDRPVGAWSAAAIRNSASSGCWLLPELVDELPGSRPRGSGDAHPGSSGTVACPPWPSGTPSWRGPTAARPPRRAAVLGASPPLRCPATCVPLSSTRTRSARLDVRARAVGDTADRGAVQPPERGVRSMMVVHVQPSGKGPGAVAVPGVGTYVGPLLEQGAG